MKNPRSVISVTKKIPITVASIYLVAFGTIGE